MLTLHKAIAFIVIVHLKIVFSIEFCAKLSSDQKTCVKCIEDFQLIQKDSSNNVSICVSNCLDFLYYSFDTKKCSSSCTLNQIGDKDFKVCREIYPCPILMDVGQDYHIGSVTTLIFDSRTQQDSNTKQASQLLITISDSDQYIKLWSMNSGELKSTFSGHTQTILKVFLIQLKDELISFSINGEIIIWDYLKGQIKQKQQVTIGQLTSQSAIDISSTLVTFFGFQGEFFVYNYSTKISTKYIGHSNIVNRAIFYQQKYIITSSLDKSVILWNLVGIISSFNILCEHDSAPAGIQIISFKFKSEQEIQFDFLLSFGSENNDALMIKITDLNSEEKKCKVALQGDHQFPIIGIIQDVQSYSFISYSTQEIIAYGFSITTSSFKLLQKINSAYFNQILLLPIKGAYLNYAFFVIYSEYGKFIVLNYKNSNSNAQGSIQTVINTEQAQPVQLARRDIRGIQLDLTKGLLYIYGQQIVQINLQKFQVNYVINNLVQPFIKHTQNVTELAYHEEQNLIATTSTDGLSMTYDFISGKIINVFFHPDYLQSYQQPQGKSVVLLKGIAICVAYNYNDKDNNIICYHAINGKVIYKLLFKQNIIRLYPDQVNGYLIANSVDYLNISSPFEGKIIIEKKSAGSFYITKFYINFNLMTSSIKGDLIRWNYPDLSVKYQGSSQNLNPNNSNYVGFAFGVDMDGMHVSYYSEGLIIIYYQNLTIFKYFNENTAINRCGLVQGIMISCMSQSGMVISHGIDTDFKFYKKLFDFPLTYSDLLVRYNKAMIVIDFGSIGGSLVFCDVETNLAETQFLSPGSILNFQIDENKQRVFIANTLGDIMVSHFNPFTYYKLQRDDKTPLERVYLLQTEQMIVILSNIITIYDYFEKKIYRQNQNHSNNISVKGIYFEEEKKIIISYNYDINQNLQIWNYETDKSVMLKGHSKGVNGVQFIISENIIITYGQDGLIIIWNYNDNLQNISSREIKQHGIKNIISLQIFNKYNPFIVSFDDGGNLYITNYSDGVIMKAVKAPLMKNMILDLENDRVFLYGVNIVVYNVITGTKISDLLGYDGNVQNILFKNDYIIAYGNLLIQSYQRSTLKFLYQSKFKKNVYQAALLKNLVGMVGNNIDNSIELWDYTTGVMLSDIKNIHYPSNVIGIYQDEESLLFVVQNVLNEMYTVTPFTDSLYKVKDFLLSPMSASYIKQCLFDKVSNKLIAYNNDMLIVWNYYTYLGLQGSAFILPSESMIMSAYNSQKDEIVYADLERNIWAMNSNILSYKIQLSFTPIELYRLANTYIVSDGSNLYSYDINLKQISKLPIFPFKIYINKENEKAPFLFVQAFDYSIIQVHIDFNTSTLQLMFQYKDHSIRIYNCIFNNYYGHIITYDISGKFSINNFMTQKNVIISTKFTKIIRDIQMDIANKWLLICSENGIVTLFSYTSEQIQEIKTLTYTVQVVSSLMDSVRQEVLIWSDLQQIIEVRDLKDTNLKIKKKIRTPGDYMVKLQYSKDFDILCIYNPFQVNFHDRKQNDKIINSLRMPSTLYDIIAVHFLSQQLIIIQSRSSIRLIRLLQSEIITEKVFEMLFPTILSLNYENDLIIKLKGVNIDTAFNYTFPFANDQKKQTYSVCYSNFQRTSSYFQLSQDLEVENNSFLKLEQKVSRIVLNVEMDDSQSFFFVQQSNSNSNNDQIERLYVYNKKSSETQQRIKLYFDSFLDFAMETLTLKNFEWKVNQSKTYQFNQNTKNVILFDSIFKDDILNTSFVFDQLTTFQVDKLTIQDLRIFNQLKIQRNLQILSNQQSILFQIKNSETVYINELTIKNCKIQNYYQIFQILNAKNVIINNLLIQNVTYFEYQESKQSIWSTLINIQNCQNIVINHIDIKDCKIKLQDLKIKIQDSPITIAGSPFIILQLQANKQVNINTLNALTNENIMFLDISQAYTQQGVGQFKVFNDIILIQDMHVNQTNSTEGYALVQIQSDNFTIKKSSFTESYCNQSNGCALDIKESMFTIDSCQFSKLTSLIGGAISVRNSPQLSQIQDCIFEQNTSSIGGAIFIDSSNIDMKNTKIEKNTAEIGGALRYINFIPNFIKEGKHFANNTFGNSVKNNQANIYGQNVGSYPRKMKLKANQNINLIFEQTDISSETDIYSLHNFMSGGQLTFEIQIYDEEDGLVEVDGAKDQNSLVYKEIQSYNLECVSKQKKIVISGSKAAYNSKSKAYEFSGIMLKAKPSTSEIFNVFNNMILVPDSKQGFKSLPYVSQIKVSFRKCIRGEIYQNQTSSDQNVTYCYLCPDQKYSLVEPVEPGPDSEEQQCKLCPEQAQNCSGSNVTLKNGYWREDEYSELIESCINNKDNCVGEQNYTNICKRGYIGPLCEQCDLKGKISGQRYMNDGQYKCVSCKDQQSVALMYIVAVLFGSCYLLFGIRQAVHMTKIKVQCYYLRMMGLASVGTTESTDQSDVYLKQLMHFVQMSSIVYSIDLPSVFFFFSVSIGTPIDSLKYSQDCRSVFASNLIPPVFGRVIWSQFIAIGFVLFLSALYYISHLVKVTKVLKRGHLITGGAFMFLFLQPNIISGLVSIISCRSIGTKLYITADVTLECYTDEHTIFFFILFVPLFVIWAIIIPSLFIYNLYKNKHRLNYCSVRMKYGFLYQEYKHSKYYWEFNKINLKILIVFVCTFFNQQLSIKSTLCTLILFSYLILSLFKSPYTCIAFNRCDQYMNIVLIACLQLNIFVKNSTNQILVDVGSTLLFIINYSFMFYLILNVVSGKFRTYAKILIKRFPFLKSRCLTLITKFDLIEYNKMRTYRNWSIAIKLIGMQLSKRQNTNADTPLINSNNQSIDSTQFKFYDRSKSLSKKPQFLEKRTRISQFATLEKENLQTIGGMLRQQTGQVTDYKENEKLEVDEFYEMTSSVGSHRDQFLQFNKSSNSPYQFKTKSNEDQVKLPRLLFS